MNQQRHKLWRLAGLTVAATLAATGALAAPVTLETVAVKDGGGRQYRLEIDAAWAPSWREVNVGRLVLRTPGASRRLAADGADLGAGKKLELDLGKALDASLGAGGCAVVLADVGPSWEKGRPDAWERISHAAKIVVCGPPPAAPEPRLRAGALVMAKSGSRAEVQPLANVAMLRPGADLPVRVYCDGEATAGRSVSALAADGSRRWARTDRVGAAVFAIDTLGVWTVEVDCGLVGADRAKRRDALPLGASLTFEVSP